MLSKLRTLLSQARLNIRPVTGSSEVDQGHSDLDIPALRDMPDRELEHLNDLLPWAAFVNDARGRSFGRPYARRKRNEPQSIPDRRIVELDRRYGLDGRHVLEAGCFEGIHTVGLMQQGASVTAFDGRIENVVKTLVRCWAFDLKPDVFHWNVEGAKPAHGEIQADILHHVGVLYHLTDPIGHLASLLPKIREAVMLDTHIAPEGAQETAVSAGFEYRYSGRREAGRAPPFAGLADHAKWVELDDLVRFLRQSGFVHVDIAEQRDERNGPRVLLFAHR